MSSIQNRIIVTEKGQEIQYSIGEEVRLMKQHQERQKKEQEQKNKSLNDESQISLQSALSANSSLKMMEHVSKKFQVIQNSGSHAKQKIIEMLAEENNFSSKDLSPYVLSQINKMTDQIIGTNHPRNHQGKSLSTLHTNLQSLENSMNFNRPLRTSESHNTINHQQQQVSTPNAQNHHNSSIMTNLSIVDDNFVVEKCNAILHCEARVDRIMKRYKKYKQETVEIDSRVKRACERKREELAEINLKPPKRLDELRQDHEDISEILNKVDKQDQNKKIRILETMKKKYQKVWQTSHIPELTEKFKELHRLHFRNQDDDDEEEDVNKSISITGKNTSKQDITTN